MTHPHPPQVSSGESSSNASRDLAQQPEALTHPETSRHADKLEEDATLAICFDRVARQRDELATENARLRQALEPFAKAADKLDLGDLSARWSIKLTPTDYSHDRARVTLDDFRKARAALSPKLSEGEG